MVRSLLQAASDRPSWIAFVEYHYVAMLNASTLRGPYVVCIAVAALEETTNSDYTVSVLRTNAAIAQDQMMKATVQFPSFQNGFRMAALRASLAFAV